MSDYEIFNEIIDILVHSTIHMCATIYYTVHILFADTINKANQ